MFFLHFLACLRFIVLIKSAINNNGCGITHRRIETDVENRAQYNKRKLHRPLTLNDNTCRISVY